MRVIYPPLVEQAYQFISSQGIEATKEDVYRMMVSEGMLTQNGNPTEKALNQGLVKEYKQQHDTLKAFKRDYRLFRNYPAKEFTKQEGVWYVSQKIIQDIQVILDANNCDHETFIQIETYFRFRNYDNPHGSIAETKGVFHPLYTPYDDSEFQVVNELVVIPKSVLFDIVRRCEIGDLEVDGETFQGFKEMLTRMEEEQIDE